MTAEVLARLGWAGAGGFVLIGAALLVGRLSALHPSIKVWACRFVSLKMLIGVLIAVPYLQAGPRATLPESPIFGLFLLSIWLAGLSVVVRTGHCAVRAASGLQKRAQRVRSVEVSQLAIRMGVLRLAVKELGHAPEPFVVGALRPVLIVPQGDPDLSTVAHEIAHVRHRDLQWNMVAWISYAVFWFVPGVGRLVRELSLWQEAWADLVARETTAITPGQQAKTLVAALRPTTTASMAIASFGGDVRLLERRVKAMYEATYSKPMAGVVAVLVLLLAIPIRAVPADTISDATAFRAMISADRAGDVRYPIASPSFTGP